ncbi:hypothetical protein Zmor_003496 [Zophobas morio]|uniref:Uncharacterized protein n=1 Tax=Zophobas morio TaxID=2755281 RepID=A0AA38HN91_9CUCU|nr:hypothetical protein Zmor_003496 [Zophobas morio]
MKSSCAKEMTKQRRINVEVDQVWSSLTRLYVVIDYSSSSKEHRDCASLISAYCTSLQECSDEIPDFIAIQRSEIYANERHNNIPDHNGAISIGFLLGPCISASTHVSSELAPSVPATIPWLPSILLSVTDHLSPYFSPVLALPCNRMFLTWRIADHVCSFVCF